METVVIDLEAEPPSHVEELITEGEEISILPYVSLDEKQEVIPIALTDVHQSMVQVSFPITPTRGTVKLKEKAGGFPMVEQDVVTVTYPAVNKGFPITFPFIKSEAEDILSNAEDTLNSVPEEVIFAVSEEEFERMNFEKHDGQQENPAVNEVISPFSSGLSPSSLLKSLLSKPEVMKKKQEVDEVQKPYLEFNEVGQLVRKSGERLSEYHEMSLLHKEKWFLNDPERESTEIYEHLKLNQHMKLKLQEWVMSNSEKCLSDLDKSYSVLEDNIGLHLISDSENIPDEVSVLHLMHKEIEDLLGNNKERTKFNECLKENIELIHKEGENLVGYSDESPENVKQVNNIKKMPVENNSYLISKGNKWLINTDEKGLTESIDSNTIGKENEIFVNNSENTGSENTGSEFDRLCLVYKNEKLIKSDKKKQVSKVHINKSEQPALSCEICSRQFNSSTELEMHYVCYSDSKPYLCQGCSEQFERLAMLDIQFHKANFKKLDAYECIICFEKFKNFETLNVHFDNHLE